METPINEPIINAHIAQAIIFYLCSLFALLFCCVAYGVRKKLKNRKNIDNPKN
jgi:hypothetical protein